MKYQALYPLEIQCTRNAIFYTSQKGFGQFSMKGGQVLSTIRTVF